MIEKLTLEEMSSIYNTIIKDIGSDIDAKEIYNELLSAAIRYTDFRAGWSMMTNEEKLEKDSDRTSAHDSLIIKFNMLSRYLSSTGHDIEWREILGYIENDPLNRKRIGDMANFLVFAEAIKNR